MMQRKRYESKIPPGYCDVSRKPEPDRFGDYVAWTQLIEFGKSRKCSLILVTDDSKDDWWLRLRGDLTLGPRPELLEEYMTQTNSTMYMYSVDSFMIRAGEYLRKTVPPEAIQEAKERRTEEWSASSLKAKVPPEGVGLPDLGEIESQKHLAVSEFGQLPKEVIQNANVEDHIKPNAAPKDQRPEKGA